MKKSLLILFVTSTVFALNQDAVVKKAPAEQDSDGSIFDQAKPAGERQPARFQARQSNNSDADLAEALALAKSGRYAESSRRLFNLSYSPRFQDRRMQIKFMLGLTLQKMNLPQLAAFQYMTVVKDGNSQFANQALERLSQVADRLNDDSLLNYAYSKIKIDSFPRTQRDRLFLRIGEFERRHGQFAQAASTLGHVGPGHYYAAAKYQQGLAFAEANQPEKAANVFEQLIDSRRNASVNDGLRAAGYMGKARSLYQKKDWDGSIAAYREIPKDTWPWHDTLFESSWAMLRSGRFRSALSNFHSLHSAFYENTYLPESLILRSIVYLYICKYDETEKVLNLFGRMYKPAYQKLDNLLRDTGQKASDYFNTEQKILTDYRKDPEGTLSRSYAIPYVVASRVSHEADFQRSYVYVRMLAQERNTVNNLPASWRGSPIGQYSRKVLDVRLAKAHQHAGRQIHSHLIAIHNELLDLLEQEGFIRYEIINGRKEELKKRIAGKELPATQIDATNERAYYIQNGFEYWPFRGEYWLDELGNYHYVGTQSCH
jgi:hypothetical protein